MSLGTVFEVGTRILRRHWGVLLLMALLFVGPGALLSSATAMRFTEVFVDLFPEFEDGVIIDTGRVFSNAELERAIDAVLPFLGASLLAGVLGSIGALAFSAIVAEDYHARPAETGVVLRKALQRTPSALVFMLVTGLLITGLIASGLLVMSVVTLILPTASVGGGGPGVFLALVVAVAMALALVYLTMRWAPAYPVMVEEDAGWREALRRAWHLSGDNVLRIFAVSLIVALVTAIISSVLGGLFEAFLGGLVGPALGLDELVTSTIALAMASLIVAPAMAVFTAVLYFDLRARRDLPAPPATMAPPSEPFR
jgi:hypothetical protein